VPTHTGRLQFGRFQFRLFQSKFLLMVVPGLIASGIAAAVLYAIHVARAPESTEFLTDVAAQGDGLSAEERRELTRQMLKARRENQEEPARVRPTAKPSTAGPSTAKPSTTGIAEDTVTVLDAKTRADRTPAAAPSPAALPLPAARPAVARTRPDSVAPVAPAATASASLPPPAVITPPVASQPTSADASLLPPTGVHVNPPLGSESEPPPRGLVANVFSSISVLAGSAANATGNSVNWVIDLPGKAISAGGKLLGGDSAANNAPSAMPPPAVAPPPATGPPPKRNF
jgi:hypothetical protein